jgi:hypothetical protein
MRHAGQAAFARDTVPRGTSASVAGSKTSKAISGGWPFGRSTRIRSARRRLAFFESQNDRTSRISAPHSDASQWTVRAQR